MTTEKHQLLYKQETHYEIHIIIWVILAFNLIEKINRVSF